ncbi:hypothetical protein [Rhizohabitans arisaemae]|uniref:hypothetical protein n=1 Tax=Rhizohabitans arisaemae TaxID=2720610 RepID=UPI0024B23415|nr:hypothetical protein [Rhizohabitans arisaemae]
MDIPLVLSHFQTHTAPLTLTRSGDLTWDDAELHRTAGLSDPEGYALLALVPGVRSSQRARVLLHTLATSQAGLDERTRRTLAKVTRALLFGLPPAEAMTVLLALRRLRANHKHTTRAVLAFVLEHPDAAALIEARRPALVDCFEHALGKATARACARRIDEGDTGSDYLRSRLLRFTADPATAIERVWYLYAPGTHGATARTDPPVPLEAVRAHEPIVTPTNRGDVAATLVHLYRGGPAAELRPALARYTAEVTRGLPRLPGSVALVLDTSGSMRGYGDREWAVLSQASALRLVLAEVVEELTVIEVGGGEANPEGATDLATGLLDALDTGPDLVAIVTDGYENLLPGDLARVAATLPRAGVTVPVVLCQATFSGRDDLTLRNPAPGLPQRRFWHQDDFAELLPWMFAHCAPGRNWIRTAVLNRLEGGRP